MKRSLRTSLLALAACLSLASCLKKDREMPPDLSGYDPNLPTNMTIDSLKKLKLDPDTSVITENWVVDAVVIADDRSGNLYKQIVVQDETGGIAIGIDAYSLYANYPVGRKIYINLKGLFLGANNGTPVLGGSVSETGDVLGIGANILADHIVKATVGNPVKDTVLTYEQARVYTASTEYALVNRLVTITGVQFADTSRTYTEATATTNRYITTCGDNTYTGLNPAASLKLMAVRTSNYANFHAYKLPAGNGTIRGIFTVYNTTPQLLLRDTSDVQFRSPRCTGSGGSGGGTGGGGGGTTGTIVFSENFGSSTTGDIILSGWTNVAVKGAQKWKFSNAGSTTNPYARISAFNTNDTAVTSWLVTPAINLAGAVNPVLTFKSANGFDNGATLKVYVSTNFSGNVATAAWTPLSAILAPLTASGYSSFTSSGNVSLASYASGNVWIAWVYEGGDKPTASDDRTTTWEIDDVSVTKQ